MKRRTRRSKESMSNSSNCSSRTCMKAKAMKEINVAEAEAEVVDEVEAVVVDGVGVLIIATSTTMRKVKVLQQVVREAIQTQGTINLKFNVIIVRIMGIIHQNAELPAVRLKKRSIM